MIDLEKHNIPFEEIHEKVCLKFGLGYHDIFKETRKRVIVEGRQIFCFVAKKITRNSLDAIGEYIGHFRTRPLNHATVLHAKKTIQNLIDVDRVLRNDISDIIEEFYFESKKQSIVVCNVNLLDMCKTT